MAYKERECIAIKKGDNGWNAIAILPVEFRFAEDDKDALKKLEDFLSIKDGRDFYDFRIDPKTWLIWLKKKSTHLNIVTER